PHCTYLAAHRAPHCLVGKHIAVLHAAFVRQAWIVFIFHAPYSKSLLLNGSLVTSRCYGYAQIILRTDSSFVRTWLSMASILASLESLGDGPLFLLLPFSPPL
ncbi:hypothetical protein HAX54_017660, partial [Datura stramonium]|nr:hypothetical protein [Datura stramonium]